MSTEIGCDVSMQAFKMVTICVLVLGLVAIGIAQTPVAKEASRVRGGDSIISTSTLMPIGLVVALIGLIVTIAVSMSDAKNHRNDKEIHHTSGELQKSFASSEDCQTKHREITDSFRRVYEKFDEVKTEVGDMKTEMRTGFAEIKGILNRGDK